MKVEIGTFLGRIPYAQVGTAPAGTRPIVVLSGGQAFVQRQTPDRLLRDAGRLERILPRGRSFVMLGYHQAPREDYSLATIVADVVAIVEELGGPVAIVGISYGGVIALHVAAARPDLVTHVALVVSAHDFSAEGKRRVEHQIDCAQRGDYAALVADFAAVFRRGWLNWLLRLRLRSQRDRLAEVMNETPVIVRGLRALLDAPLADTAPLGRITAPVLIIGGSADQFFGGMFEPTAAAIPNATLAVFDGETHMVPVERARAVAAKLRGFLR
jgi:pimeloyl-ACP methyl ester carboxylesterase